jgi:CRP-like cAMP-binding protein
MPATQNTAESFEEPWVPALDAGLARSISNRQYETVQQIAEQLQPSHLEYDAGLGSPTEDVSANILALSGYLQDDLVETCKQVVEREYGNQPSFREARLRLAEACEEVEDFSAAHSATSELVRYYTNVYIYHSAEHMLSMTKDCVQFAGSVAEELGLPESERQRMMKRLLVSGLYHDAGNGRYPRNDVGRDELDAVETFLVDFRRAEFSPQLAYITDLDRDEAVQIVGNIVATVFRDRHATAETIKAQPYFTRALDLLEEHGVPVTAEELVDRVTSVEGLIIRNADIAASLKAGNLVKNTFTVQFENCLKSPIFFGKSFADSRNGFVSFLEGSFQEAIHGEKTDLSREAEEGNLMLNPGGRFATFARRNEEIAQSRRELQMTLTHDREICDGMLEVVENNLRQKRFDVLMRPLKDLAPVIEAQIGEAFDQYREAFEQTYADRCIIDMTQDEVNEVFQQRTREVNDVLAQAAVDSREEHRVLAAAYEGLRPNTWQAAYILRLLEFGVEYPEERYLSSQTVHPSEDPFLRKGDTSIETYIVLGGDGVLDVQIDGKTVDKIGPVNIFGEISVLEGARTADIYVQNDSLELIEVSDRAVRVMSSESEFRDVLEHVASSRLANGDVATHVDDKELQRVLGKLFDFNLYPAEPDMPIAYQEAIRNEELRGIAVDRGWEVRKLEDAGERFITHGEEPECVFVVIGGEAVITLPENGPVLSRGAGSILGEMSLLEPDHAATADVAAGPEGVELICIPRELFALCPEAVRLLREKRIAEREE